ncbi:MAG: hypothetical protein IRZ08_14310 [Frankia sp.]|nr:hypothetical protein [Frankia sp.]
MDAVRRGYLGLMLFIAALVLMPLLVLDYHRRTGDDDSTAPTLAGAGRSAILPGTAGTANPLTEPSPAEGIVGFAGVIDGQELHGTVRITLTTRGEIGPVTFTLTGYQQRWEAPGPPYLFAPHPDGWQTTAVANGQYTLTATPADPRLGPRSVTFQVRNP